MSDYFKNVANGIVIPIAMVGLIVGGIFFLGRIVEKVDYNDAALAKVQDEIKVVPTREEFSNLKDDVGEIKKDVKVLLQRN